MTNRIGNKLNTSNFLLQFSLHQGTYLLISILMMVSVLLIVLIASLIGATWAILSLLSLIMLSVMVWFLLKPRNAILFFILLLPIHQLSMMAILHFTNSWTLVRLAQPWKEVLVLIVLVMVFGVQVSRGFHFQWRQIDALLVFFVGLNLLMLLTADIPISVQVRGLRTNTMFVFFYLLGRLMPLGEQTRRTIILAILVLGIVAGMFALIDRFALPLDWPLRLSLDRYLTGDQGGLRGQLGLSWTYWTSSGLRRASSFFANPLDYAASAHIIGVTALCVYLIYEHKSRLRTVAALTFVLVSIGLLLSISRMAIIVFAVECLVVIMLTRRYRLLPVFIGGALLITISVVLREPAAFQHVVETITFENPSSRGHVDKWLEAIASMEQHPLGIGLGQSGVVGMIRGEQIGGENQYLIFGVELGFPGLILYALIQLVVLRYCYRLFRRSTGTVRILALVAFTSRLGIAVSGFTAAVETYIFLSYVNWWLVGYAIQQLKSYTSVKHDLMNQHQLTTVST